jgi:hypothetical protein
LARIVPSSKLAEFAVLIWLFFILIVTALSLAVVLWAGTFFFQGYIYTQPSAGIFWQAPAAAALLTFGYTVWCLSIALSTGATPQNLPIDTIVRFSPEEQMADLHGRPAARIWSIKKDPKKTGDDKDGERTLYVSKRDSPTKFHYQDESIRPRPWQRQDVIAFEIEIPDKENMRFDLTPTEPGAYRDYVSKEGWTIREYEEGPTGVPVKFGPARFFWNLFFNFGHLVCWFIGLWLLLRFQWAHALGFAVVLWLVATLFILPMMLGYAGLVAANRQSPTALLITLGGPVYI